MIANNWRRISGRFCPRAEMEMKTETMYTIKAGRAGIRSAG